jgi:hypothetical protein
MLAIPSPRPGKKEEAGMPASKKALIFADGLG